LGVFGKDEKEGTDPCQQQTFKKKCHVGKKKKVKRYKNARREKKLVLILVGTPVHPLGFVFFQGGLMHWFIFYIFWDGGGFGG